MQQNLSKFTIYTIASKDKLVTASNNKGATKFTEAHPWTTGYDLWSKADHVGEAMPVVFADAGECGPLLYWGVLNKVVIEGKITHFFVTQVLKIKGQHLPQELFLRSTGKTIAPGFIRPYAICKTPVFLR